ncbi:MAG TPA: Na+/H+ antiporter NhaA [Balneolales bacterium]|nr:Na+/H+ antiporter NhaA [Balneolales bacterium]
MKKKSISKTFSPFQEFVRTESFSGVLLIIATLLALLIANTSLNQYYRQLLTTSFSIGFSGVILDKPLILWVNDGLMALFFLLVALEIKRELFFGQLAGFQKAILPVLSAVGGAFFPAIIFLVLNYGTKYSQGWAIPMATDIAFAIGILSLLGRYIPIWAKVFITALAVADDLFAILIIAIFYTDKLYAVPLIAGLIMVLILGIFNLFKIKKLRYYILVGIILWVAILKSGIHATIAGVLLGFMIPLSQHVPIKDIYKDILSSLNKYVPDHKHDQSLKIDPEHRETMLNSVHDIVKHSESPLHRLEHAMNPFVGYVVMPVFAFFNAGITLNGSILTDAFQSTLVWGIILGLFFGNQIGIFGVSWTLTKFGQTDLPVNNQTRSVLYGLSCLGGIGFTMSLFISNLAFTDPHTLELSKIGILTASILSAFVGLLILRWSYKK